MKFNELVGVYNATKGKYKSLLLEVQELRELGGLPQNGIEGMPKSKNSSSPVENYVIRLNDLENQIIQKDKELAQLRDLIREQFINQLDDYFVRRVIEMVIFRDRRRPDWRKISQDVCYSERHCQRLYDEGIAELQKLEVLIDL